MKILLPVLLPLLLLSAAACEKKEERILPKVDSAAQSAVDQSKLERDAFIQEAQKEVDELGEKLAQLRKKSREASGSAKEKLDQQIVKLEQEQKAVAEKLANLKSVIGEKWKDLKSDFTTTLDKFRQSVKNAF